MNLGLAASTGIPAILVGDIERGGVFASLFGTMALLPPDRRRQVGGFVINKFRGDGELLRPALDDLERRAGVTCLGVIPHGGRRIIDSEDTLAIDGMRSGGAATPRGDTLDVAVCLLPLISNFTDMDPLVLEPGVSIRLVDGAASLGDPDLIIVPGAKVTVAALEWLRSSGLDRAIARARVRGSAVLGICAGLQMLGRRISDCVESGTGEVDGLGWLPLRTRFDARKVTRRRSGRVGGLPVSGYEIRHGRPAPTGPVVPWFELDDRYGREGEGVADLDGVWATSLHGVFEEDAFRGAFLEEVAHRRGKRFLPGSVSFRLDRDRQIDDFADLVEQNVDLEAIYHLIEAGRR